MSPRSGEENRLGERWSDAKTGGVFALDLTERDPRPRDSHMLSYYCDTCVVACPPTAAYRRCIGCGRCLASTSEYEPLAEEIAEHVRNHLHAEREMDECEVRRFREEMETVLGPSHG